MKIDSSVRRSYNDVVCYDLMSVPQGTVLGPILFYTLIKLYILKEVIFFTDDPFLSFENNPPHTSVAHQHAPKVNIVSICLKRLKLQEFTEQGQFVFIVFL